MNFIEYRIINDESFLCTYRTNNKNIIISSEEAEDKFKLLKRSNFKCNTFNDENDTIIRFYGTGIDDFYNMNFRRKNIKRKVNRRNIFISGTLCVSLLVTCYIGHRLIKDIKKDILDNLNDTKNFEYELIIEEPNISSNITIDENIDTIEDIPETKEFIETIDVQEETYANDIINNIPDNYFYFEYEDRSGTDKAKNCRDSYYDCINKYSNMYGVPTNLMVAIATQENGVHDTKISKGGGFGLFQIQAKGTWNWLGKEITVYNFETLKNETVTVCLNSSNCIDMNMLSNLEYNTKVACMLMAYNLKLCNYDIIQALQVYNSGTGVISLNKKYGEDWVNHRGNLPGDPKYLEHVLSYIEPTDNILNFYDKYNNSYSVGVNNICNSMNLHR